jgi:hypothetical protein
MTTQTRKTTQRSTGRRATKSSSDPEIPEERIRMRAYEIYLARGDGAGDAVSDWHQAERELNGSTDDT